MQATKPEIIFTFPIALGGVSSFNFNLINNSKLLQNFTTKVILLKDKNETRPSFTEKFNVDEQIIFESSSDENQFHRQKRLSKLLGGNNGAIVTDNGLTIETARRFNNCKTIFSLIHDYYYVTQQINLGDWADVVVSHASFFGDAVFASNPIVWAGRTFFVPYGVKQLSTFPQKNNKNLKVVFLGRLEESKGVLNLIDIQKQLALKNVQVNWTIIGKGSLKNELLQQWQYQDGSFFEPNTTDEVYDLLVDQDVFVFPTTFEGTPVAILEAMSCGIVTIVNDLPGGIRDIVTDKTGFRCKNNNTNDYVDVLVQLNENRKLLHQMQQDCYEIATTDYDVKVNADNYVKLFLQYKKLHRPNKSTVKKLKKLDKPYFPNWFTTTIRIMKNNL